MKEDNCKDTINLCDCDDICVIPACRPHNNCCCKCPTGATGPLVRQDQLVNANVHVNQKEN